MFDDKNSIKKVTITALPSFVFLCASLRLRASASKKKQLDPAVNFRGYEHVI